MQFRKFIVIAFAGLLVSCGGGSEVDSASQGTAGQHAVSFPSASRAAMEAVLANQTSIALISDFGDYIGDGGSYAYNEANAVIQVEADGNRLGLRIRGDEGWNATFVLPSARSKFVAGIYSNLTRYPFHDAAVGGMDWSGEGRGCNQLNASLRVNSAEYVGDTLVSIDLDFIQHCEGDSPALHGSVRWFANDPTVPPGPQRNVPDRLWSPAPDATPATGSFVYLESSATDFVGDGKTYAYTRRNSHLQVTESDGLIQVKVDGNEDWTGDFKAMVGVSRTRPGWYRDLQRYPFHNPAKGGLSWSGDGRGCNRLIGWYALDEITYVDGKLATLDLRFEQRCQDLPSWTGPLYGRIRWDASDTSAPAGPRRIPERLWAPRAAATPATGNYVYLDSSPGDYIGGGVESTYTTGLSLSANARTLNVNAGGYTGTFVAMDSIPRLKRGYYPGLQRWPFHNPALGGLDWSGNGRGCNELQGWFAIDDIRRDALGALMALDMRFAQRCEITDPPLFGAVHWVRPSAAMMRVERPAK